MYETRRAAEPGKLDVVANGLGRVMIGAFFLATPVLVFLGYKQGEHQEILSNSAKKQAAALLEDCREFGKGNDTLKLTLADVPGDIRVACDIPQLSTPTEPDLVINEDAVQIKLPTETDLNTRINNLLADANDTNSRIPLQHAAAFGTVGCGFAILGLASRGD